MPSGPGWALVGDAGLRMDPITGQGIADAFRDAELLATRSRASCCFADYRARRDEAALPMYEQTAELAAFAPPRVEHLLLYDALDGRPADISRFLGVLAARWRRRSSSDRATSCACSVRAGC